MFGVSYNDWRVFPKLDEPIKIGGVMAEDQNNNGNRRRYSRIIATHDGYKIEALRAKKGLAEEDITRTLEYGDGNINAYSRFISGRSAIGLHGLLAISELLDADISDIVMDKYTNQLSSFKISHCKDESELNDLLLSYEQTYRGRIGVFNAFPSMIYYPNDDPNRIKRFNFLYEQKTINREYYPIKAILKFGFGNFVKFKREEKIDILQKIINLNTGDYKNTDKHRISIIIDTDNFTYSPFAADCEILGDELMIVAAPFIQTQYLLLSLSNTSGK